VIAFCLGALAIGLALLVAALALGVAAEAGDWGSFRVAIGPVLLVEFERRAASTATTLGNGVLLASLACGFLNAGGAAILRRRLR
jgi:hypothetical protein